MTKLQPIRADKISKVEGPIRCHKCQLMCRDAEHYLSHIGNKCGPKPPADSLAFHSLRLADLG
jgi:hypothetical protein